MPFILAPTNVRTARTRNLAIFLFSLCVWPRKLLIALELKFNRSSQGSFTDYSTQISSLRSVCNIVFLTSQCSHSSTRCTGIWCMYFNNPGHEKMSQVSRERLPCDTSNLGNIREYPQTSSPSIQYFCQFYTLTYSGFVSIYCSIS